MKILVIDDEPACADSIALGLKLRGHELLVAYDGMQGIEMLRNERGVGLILLDLMMPGMSGLEVLEVLKQDTILSSIPVVLQTGTSDMREIEYGMKIGAAAWIQKPFSNKQLYALLQSFIDSSEEAPRAFV